VVAKDYGHLAHGYVMTSHASQGKTVDRVLIGQSSQSFRASSREQFYVSCSRGRESVRVYSDDKAALLDAVSRTDDRLAATDLFTERDRMLRAGAFQQQRAVALAPERGGPRKITREELTHER
jgi:ATP-dependent exoDNAse (exonuclease V) alpha subunit